MPDGNSDQKMAKKRAFTGSWWLSGCLGEKPWKKKQRKIKEKKEWKVENKLLSLLPVVGAVSVAGEKKRKT